MVWWAAQFKRSDVCAFCSQLTSADYAILEAADPWGEERADIRAGQQSSIAAASMGIKGVKTADCTLRFERRRKSRNSEIALLDKALTK